ncbi:unnamed protein product, partial [Didymodactylos carnosus]
MKSLLISTSQQEKLLHDETERRRTLRLLQLRQTEKQRAASLRQNVTKEKKKQTYLLIKQLQSDWLQQKVEINENLEYQFRENLMEMGKSHQAAIDQPDYEKQWLQKTVENDSKAIERGQYALDKLHTDQMNTENDRNLHLLHRKAALELEKIRSQNIAKLPLPDDPLRDLQSKPTTIVTVHDPYNFTTTRYHLEERLVNKEDDQEVKPKDALIEQERVDDFLNDKHRLWSEQQEKARVRGENALKKEVIDNAYDNVLEDLNKLERQDRERRQKEKNIFLPPWRREEERQERQRKMETAFEQVYQDKNKKQPVPIVLMNDGEEDDEDIAEHDRTLTPGNDEKDVQQYRMTTVASTTTNKNPTPTVAIMTENEFDLDSTMNGAEATLADPTLATLHNLQTPVFFMPESGQPQQQNMQRLMQKIERQRQDAYKRSLIEIEIEEHQHEQSPLQNHKTPKHLVVSPGYLETSSVTSSFAGVEKTRISTMVDGSHSQMNEADEKRKQLELRKQSLEEQIRLLSERERAIDILSSMKQEQPLVPASSSSAMSTSSVSNHDCSIESLLLNYKNNFNHQATATTTTTSSSQNLVNHQPLDLKDDWNFVQAVSAIVSTSEDEEGESSSSATPTISRLRLDRYDSHSSEDRDHSLEELISRLKATQNKDQQPQNDPLSILKNCMRQQQRLDYHDSHSTDERDLSVESYIQPPTTITTTGENNVQSQPDCLSVNQTLERILHSLKAHTVVTEPVIVDDFVDDALSEDTSSVVSNDPRRSDTNILNLLLVQDQNEQQQQITSPTKADIDEIQTRFQKEKRLIEQELEMIRQEREMILHQNRQNMNGQTFFSKQDDSSSRIPLAPPPPPPSILRSKITGDIQHIHELSTIQEVDTPVSSRNTTFQHYYQSPFKSATNDPPLERISSADNSVDISTSSSSGSLAASFRSLNKKTKKTSVIPLPVDLKTSGIPAGGYSSGLERDDSGISLNGGTRSTATRLSTATLVKSSTTASSGIGSMINANGGQYNTALANNDNQEMSTTNRIRTITNDSTTNSTTVNTNSGNQNSQITPRSDDSLSHMSSVSKKWRDILANECNSNTSATVPTIVPNAIENQKQTSPIPQQQQQYSNFQQLFDLDRFMQKKSELTHSFGFTASHEQQQQNLTKISPQINANTIGKAELQTPVLPSVSRATSSSSIHQTQEQLLREQYSNEECDLMSLLKVHEYLTKQHTTVLKSDNGHSSSPVPFINSTVTQLSSFDDELNSPLYRKPHHQNSASTLTSVTYRSSLINNNHATSSSDNNRKQSFSSHTSSQTAPVAFKKDTPQQQSPSNNSSFLNDIQHLSSPNTFETSMTSSRSPSSKKPVDTLSYLIEQNQLAMNRLVSLEPVVDKSFSTSVGSKQPTKILDFSASSSKQEEKADLNSTVYSSASVRQVEYESGLLTTFDMNNQNQQTIMTTNTTNSSLYQSKTPDSYTLTPETRQMIAQVFGDEKIPITVEEQTEAIEKKEQLSGTTNEVIKEFSKNCSASAMTEVKTTSSESILETGSLATFDFLNNNHLSIDIYPKIDLDEKGIMDEPSITLPSNSYRSLSSNGQHLKNSSVQRNSHMSSVNSLPGQMKKCCSSPLSDKTSACTTPSLSPIKADYSQRQTPHLIENRLNGASTPLISSQQHQHQHQQTIRQSITTSSDSSHHHKHKTKTNKNNESLLSFEKHELSAGGGLASDESEIKSLDHSPIRHNTENDWSYFITVNEQLELPKSLPVNGSPSSSSMSSSISVNSKKKSETHIGGVEFFVHDNLTP